MNIAVCMKQVPSSNEVKIDPVTKTIVRDGKQSVINPFDSSALELAVRIKESLGGTVTAVSMGIPDAARLLRDALSRGCDRAALLSDKAFAGADTLATSYTLSLGIEKLGKCDLIICGKMAVDGDTAQIGPELAEALNVSLATDVEEIVFINDKEIICWREIDGGRQLVNVPLPALITVVKGISQPRMPSISSIRFSKTAPLDIYTAEDLDADTSRTGLEGSPTQVVKTFVPLKNSECIELKGDAKSLSRQIASIIKEVK